MTDKSISRQFEDLEQSRRELRQLRAAMEIKQRAKEDLARIEEKLKEIKDRQDRLDAALRREFSAMALHLEEARRHAPGSNDLRR